MSVRVAAIPNDEILRRVCGEYMEMPGLRLTRPQAQRLWALDEDTCGQVLEFLVRIGFLACTGTDSRYRRVREGPESPLRLWVAKARLDVRSLRRRS